MHLGTRVTIVESGRESTRQRARISPMVRHLPPRVSVVAAGLLLAFSPLALSAHQDNSHCRKCKLLPPTSRIVVTVLRHDDGTPIRNAAVVFSAIQGDKDKGSMELKTNDDGVAVMTVIPIGDTVLLQVIASDFQTFGREYKVSKAQMSMHIRLKRPGQQYSIYDNREDADTGSSKGGNQSGAGSGNGSGGSSNAKSSAPPKQ